MVKNPKPAAGGRSAPSEPAPPAPPPPEAGAAGTEAGNDAPAPDPAPGNPAPEPDPDAGALFAGDRSPAVPDAACGEAVRAFLDGWNADRPAEAVGGSYGATSRDRWAEQSFEAIPDGYVFAGGWAFVFEGGRFVGGGQAIPMAATG